MAMTILNNTASMMTLGELNKNITRVGKDLQKLSKGERLAKFADSPSEVAISEKMRELVRSLGQNEKNVQTGASLMKVAEGGVKEQLELLKTVKQKVIDAANDSNTDTDRAIIQKEIDQCFKQMEDIAQTTNYNGKRLLSGDPTDFHREMVPTIVYHPVLFHDQPIWVQLDEPKFIEESQIGWTPDGDAAGIIPDNYPKLDDIEGPFDVFKQVDPTAPVALNTFGIEASYTANAFSGGEDGEPKKLTIDFGSVYNNVSDLDGKGFTLGGVSYVFTTDMQKRYATGEKSASGIPIECTKIDISSCLTFGDVANAMASAMSGNNAYTPSVSAGKITFSTRNLSQSLEAINSAAGFGEKSGSGYTEEIVTSPAIPAHKVYTELTGVHTVTNTGAIANIEYFGGGKNDVPAQYAMTEVYDHTNDKTVEQQKLIRAAVEGEKAAATVDVSSAPEGSGIVLHGNTDAYIFFKEGSDAPSTFPAVDENGNASTTNPAIYFVGKNYKGDIALPTSSGMTAKLSSGSLTATALQTGTTPNGNWYIDNVKSSSVNYNYYDANVYTEVGETPATTENRTYETFTPLDLGAISTTLSEKGATYATYNLDYTMRLPNVENFIKEMNYKTMVFHNEGNPDYPIQSYTFYDSKILGNDLGTFYTGAGGNQWINLNEIREDVSDGKTLAEAVTNLLKRNMPHDEMDYPDGLRLQAHNIGTPGNSERIHATDAGRLRHYTINFNNPAIGSIPSSLVGRGFRIYCATDDYEWWNFQMTDTDDPEFEAEQPESDAKNIRYVHINISECGNANDVAKAFYEQANEYLSGKNQHILKIAANTNTGEITFYDDRPDDLTVANGYKTLMGKGGGLDENYGWWKIADGIYADVYETTGDKWKDMPFLEEVPMQVPVKDFAIQDNPRANRTLWLKLPQTTLDKVLGFDIETESAEDFNVMTKEMRDKLLGERLSEQGEDGEVTGILDKGIVYLTDANTLIGSQIQRLNLSEANIVTKAENAQAAESVIRDADMAKEMTNFAKNNILMQASQAMMSQANQNASGVLGLLQ